MTSPLSRKDVAELCGVKAADLPKDPLWTFTRYEPPGPVGAAYIKSLGPIDAIQGPGGSGKTTASFFKIIRFALSAGVMDRKGVVRCKATIVRDNYRNLYRTTLLSWFEWFPPDFQQSTFIGGQDRPAQHVLRLATVRKVNGVAREVPVDLIVDFFALGDQTIENVLKSYETSCGYLNEADQLHIRVPTFLYGRTGRYPKLDDLPEGAIRPRMVAMDFNPTRPSHPLYKACVSGTFKTGDAVDDVSLPKELQGRVINFFEQPSGLSADAENRKGKTLAEYEQDMAVMGEDDARRMVLGKPGFSLDGKPVYARDFDRRKHVSAGPLKVLPGVPLNIGFDQAGSPAAVFFQVGPMGQMRILRELWLGHQIGVARFVEGVRAILTNTFAGLPPGQFTSDPAGFYGADKQSGETHWSGAVGAALGRAIYPAWTNEPLPRQEILRLLFSSSVDADTPKLLVDPSCEMLIEGFEAEYKFPRHKDNASTEYGDRTVKNDHANVVEAAQYGAMGIYGREFFLSSIAAQGRGGNVINMRGDVVSKGRDFSVWDV